MYLFLKIISAYKQNYIKEVKVKIPFAKTENYFHSQVEFLKFNGIS